MYRTGKTVCFISLLCLCLTGHAEDRLEIRGLIELQAVYNNAEKNWQDGGFSNTRYDSDSFPLRLGKGTSLNAPDVKLLLKTVPE